MAASDKICVYCEGIFTIDTIVCSNCNEYDGLMPLVKGLEYIGLDLGENLELLLKY